ncbi:cupin domain-containing protein [Pseudodesulfovibrio sediminis]|uniref:Cupin n=1 Tax=Pseudodesulfovibrio sediminis TaxID=2810563 RepID=A0ABN6EW90_9BACT|nr:cupin [Pseudodesulfovibrio sediminis]BCS89391.1 hypothetical protein PSDVSF_26330 [Pseudodesulfovibrio sediminis]
MSDLFTSIMSGTISHTDKETDVASLDWNQHPTFAGVALKHLITGAETEGRFSAHLVRLDAGAEIGDHIHQDSWELHEITGGSGHCLLNGKIIPYTKGMVGVIPEKAPHTVQAGSSGLTILAKFIPALL